MSTSAIVTDRQGHQLVGELLYLHFYPHAIVDKNGAVERFEGRPQRVGLRLDNGETWHFTVPREVQLFYRNDAANTDTGAMNRLAVVQIFEAKS